MTLTIEIDQIKNGITMNFKLYTSIIVNCNDKSTIIEHKVRNIGHLDIKYPNSYDISKIQDLIHYINIESNVHNVLTHYGLKINKKTNELILKSNNKFYDDIILSYNDKDILIDGIVRVLKLMREIDLVTEPKIKLKKDKDVYMIRFNYPSYYRCGNKDCKGKICGDIHCGIKEGSCVHWSVPLIKWSSEYTNILIRDLYDLKKDKDPDFVSMIISSGATLSVRYKIKKEHKDYVFIKYMDYKIVAKIDEIINLVESVKKK